MYSSSAREPSMAALLQILLPVVRERVGDRGACTTEQDHLKQVVNIGTSLALGN